MSDNTGYFLFYSESEDLYAASFSLAAEDSDISSNYVVLDHVIGTLVKLDAASNPSPYLAKNWEVSDNSKEWKFEFRDDVFDEEGNVVTLEMFRENLEENLLKYYKDKRSAFVFETLIGWDSFANHESKRVKGIETVNNRLVFKFKNKVTNLLDILIMPYFGYFKTRTGNRWPISTTGYKIFNFLGGKKVILNKNEFNNQKDDLPDRIEFFRIRDLSNLSSKGKTIIWAGKDFPVNSVRKHYNVTISDPTWLTTLIFGTRKQGIFSDLKMRTQFASNFKILLKKTTFSDNIIVPGDGLYAETESIINIDKFKEINLNEYGKEVLIHIPLFFEKSLAEKIKTSILGSFEKKSRGKIKFIHSNLIESLDISRARSNEYFDVRLTSVDTGGAVIVEAINMMFCTKLGVSFPDPNDDVKNLILRKPPENGHATFISSKSTFMEELNSVLKKHVTLVPIGHSGRVMMYSKDIDLSVLAANKGYQTFEFVRYKR